MSRFWLAWYVLVFLIVLTCIFINDLKVHIQDSGLDCYTTYYDSEESIKYTCSISGRYYPSLTLSDLTSAGYKWHVKDNERFRCQEKYNEFFSHATFDLSPVWYVEQFMENFTLNNYTEPKDFRLPNARFELMRVLKFEKFSFSRSPADVLDRMLAVLPIYSSHPNLQQELYRLHLYFISYLKSIGIKTLNIEAVFPNQNYSLNNDEGDLNLRVKIYEDVYLRENLVNVGAKKFWDEWDFLTVIDAHQEFSNTFWWKDTILKLEKHALVQMFANSGYLSLSNSTFYQVGLSFQKFIRVWGNRNSLGFLKYGNAWGFNKEYYVKMSEILDFCIAYGCDVFLNLATYDTPWLNPFSQHYPNYYRSMEGWLKPANEILKWKSHFIRGEVIHFYHQHLQNYTYLHQCFATNYFEITKEDYHYDEDGVLRITNRTISDLFEYVTNGSLPKL